MKSEKEEMRLKTAWHGKVRHFGNSNDGNDIEICVKRFK